MSVKTFGPYQPFINNVYPTTEQWGKLKYYTMVTCSSPFCANTQNLTDDTCVSLLECFQFESSRLPLFCFESQLQSRTMMLCRLGSTMPSRGLWEGSPFQQASISCQHSSSKQGKRSGLAPGRNSDISETHRDYFMLWIVLWSHCSSRLDWTGTDCSTGHRPTTFDWKSKKKKKKEILNVTKGSWDF